MLENEYKNFLIDIYKHNISLPEKEKNILLNDPDFVNYCINQKEWDYEEHSGLLLFLDMPKNEEGYYLDAFGNNISFNGNRQVKKALTKLNLNVIHENEIRKCSEDFQYFRKYYIKIMTKSGIDRPDMRDYQKRLEVSLVEEENIVASFPRQSGKCLRSNMKLKLESNGINEETTIVDLFNEIRNSQKRS